MGAQLCDSPISGPRNWIARVNRPQTQKELDALRHSIAKGRLYGSTAWVKRIADRLRLEATLRGRGRPKMTD